jgi:4-aminobutyrate aminotransferase
MIGIELCRPGTTTPDPAAASVALEACRRDGLLVGKGGQLGNVLRIAPPLTLTDEECETGLRVLANAMAELDRS